MTTKYKAVFYPGQSEEVRVGIGLCVLLVREGEEYPTEYAFTWDEKPYPAPTHETLEAFFADHPPKAGGRIERLYGKQA